MSSAEISQHLLLGTPPKRKSGKQPKALQIKAEEGTETDGVQTVGIAIFIPAN